MTFEQMIEQTGRAEVNLAPLLLIVGVALAAGNGAHLESMVERLFCSPDKL